jgi:hypothetical protein
MKDTCFWLRFVASGTDCLEIVRATFINLTGRSSELYGGALSITTTSTVLVSESKFVACYLPPASSTYGGACYIANPTRATIEHCCASSCFARAGQFIRLEGVTKNGHAVNCSSMLACGSWTPSDALAMGIYIYGLSATLESLNSTRCSVSTYGAAFGAIYPDGSFSSQYLTACNCSGTSIVFVLDNAAQATVAYSNFFWNSVQDAPGEAWGVLAADTLAGSTGNCAAMAVRNSIFSGNSPTGRSIVRFLIDLVAKFDVVNCIFSESLPSTGNASLSGNTVKVTASHSLRPNNVSLCFALPCSTVPSSPAPSSSALFMLTHSLFLHGFWIRDARGNWPRNADRRQVREQRDVG